MCTHVHVPLMLCSTHSHTPRRQHGDAMCRDDSACWEMMTALSTLCTSFSHDTLCAPSGPHAHAERHLSVWRAHLLTPKHKFNLFSLKCLNLFFCSCALLEAVCRSLFSLSEPIISLLFFDFCFSQSFSQRSGLGPTQDSQTHVDQD